MTTVVIDDQKKGAREMLEFLRTLDFVAFFETVPKNDALRIRRQKLIRHPDKYDPMALAGAAEESPIDLAQLRRGWTKRK